MRKGKLLLALKALLRALAIKADDAATHVRVVRFLHTCASATMPPAVAKVVEAQRAALGVADGVSLTQYNEAFRAKGGGAPEAELAAARMLLLLEPANAAEGRKRLEAIAPDRCTLPQAVEVHATLAASCGADAADAYAARARAHFSFASHFADKAAAAAEAEPAP